VRLPVSLVLTGKALAQMQLTVSELDPELDPFSVVGRFLMRNLITRARAGVEPKRLFYDVSKLKVRAERLIESFERISGARPGPRFQVDVRGISPLERTIRVAARRVALAVTAGSALVATGATAAAVHVASWVPITLGSVGGTFVLLLLLDLLRGDRR
jgi:predicted unusual protein kinase regulating ubiquinone biosynthesis (AarF/ABC1/UbiB family)